MLNGAKIRETFTKGESQVMLLEMNEEFFVLYGSATLGVNELFLDLGTNLEHFFSLRKAFKVYEERVKALQEN